jgi:mobilome CxxCx(11)CxxC protein
MALATDEIRQEGWKNAIHAVGTYEVFARRARQLKVMTDLRDWFGLLAIPASVAFVGTTEMFNDFRAYRQWALWGLAAAAFLQALLAGWSLIRRWDEERGYCTRAMRDSYEMKLAWEDIGRTDVQNLQAQYELRKAQQRIIDSHDIERGISNSEKRLGMRSGLFEYQKECVGCGVVPSSRKPPMLAISRCQVCGGRRTWTKK